MERKTGEGIVVCVTGASGYIASWLVKSLLERGYTVKATVRSLSDLSKIDHLKALQGAQERLHLFEANLTEDRSFDTVVDGCDGVFHTASPVPHSYSIADPQVELIQPAVEGTLNVLRSCSKVPSIKRVVLTSSMAAMVYNRIPKGTTDVVDETWFSDAEFCRQVEEWYPLSKTLAEEAAWKFAGENGMDLVVINPSIVLGPLLQPSINSTSNLILEIIIKGNVIAPTYPLVDVRDVAHAHVLAYEDSSAEGRYCLMGAKLTHSETLRALHKLYPSIKVPPVDAEDPGYQVSVKKAESLGICFMPLEVSFKDAVESMKEKGLLSL